MKFGVHKEADGEWVDLSKELDSLRWIHDERGGPRAAYAWAIGRAPTEPGDNFRTADLDTRKVEDFIAAFYAAYNARYGATF